MISNSDMVKITGSGNYVCEGCLSRNVLYNIYFSKRVMPLIYFFRWRYGESDFKCMTFEANLDNGGEI